MDGHAQAIRALVEGCADQQARWKPETDCWSMLEVMGHLLDEEREDFRARLDLVLHRRYEPRFRIDPETWVTKRRYNQRDFKESLDGFLSAREESLTWLQGLGEAELAQQFQAPFGSIRAGDILASWVAHDVLHMRQLLELKWTYLVAAVEPYTITYAGVW
jgi:hypothetical protein